MLFFSFYIITCGLFCYYFFLHLNIPSLLFCVLWPILRVNLKHHILADSAIPKSKGSINCWDVTFFMHSNYISSTQDENISWQRKSHCYRLGLWACAVPSSHRASNPLNNVLGHAHCFPATTIRPGSISLHKCKYIDTLQPIPAASVGRWPIGNVNEPVARFPIHWTTCQDCYYYYYYYCPSTKMHTCDGKKKGRKEAMALFKHFIKCRGKFHFWCLE